MSDLREAAEMALEFVDWLCGDDHSVKPKNKALEVRKALRQALAQPEQDPVACIGTNGELMWLKKPSAVYSHAQPLYTAPPKREWVEPTDEEIYKILNMKTGDAMKIAKALLAKAKEKNT